MVMSGVLDLIQIYYSKFVSLTIEKLVDVFETFWHSFYQSRQRLIGKNEIILFASFDQNKEYNFR
jgi:hypothetical protein